MTGHMTYDPLMNYNKNKTIRDKIGFLPFSNSYLQADVCGPTAARTGDADSVYEYIGTKFRGVDLNYIKTSDPVLIRITGQYEYTDTQKISYILNSDSLNFANQGNYWYWAGTIRPATSGGKFMNNREPGLRYTRYTPPVTALWGGDPAIQISPDLTCWFTWDNPLNFAYHLFNGGGEKDTSLAVRFIHRC